jgi:predicted dehydrogenase
MRYHMPTALTAVVIGAGERGYAAYGPYALAHPDEIRFVAVAEPNDTRRTRFAEAHAIPRDRQFRTWEDVLDQGKIADAALVCTMDTLHAAPALAALEAGYDVLLEKPMATTLADCVHLVQTAERTGQLLQVAHVLRYTPFFSTLHDVVTSGRLGEIVTVEHRENVVYWHMAHSYVRGNWRRRDLSSPIILAKCSHDLDVLAWNLGRCAKLNSFGSLRHFRRENAPLGAPERCTDGCPAANDCPWYAPRLYLDLIPLYYVARNSPDFWERAGASLVLGFPRLMGMIRGLIPPVARALDYREWPISAISEDTSPKARLHALETGPYGRCVYHCDNDVLDHQTVNMIFESGTSVVLVMNGHSHEEARTMRYDGTRATLRGKFTYGLDDVIEIHDHRTGRMERIEFRDPDGLTGHGGGDEGVMAAFVRAVRGGGTGEGGMATLTTARESLESHLMAFAADRARLDGEVVDMATFRRRTEVA